MRQNERADEMIQHDVRRPRAVDPPPGPTPPPQPPAPPTPVPQPPPHPDPPPVPTALHQRARAVAGRIAAHAAERW